MPAVKRAAEGPEPPAKKLAISFYDLDGTLIKPKSGAQFPKNRDDWIWWHSSVPELLKKENEEGRHLIVISNQGDPREKIKSEWRAKLSLIAAKLPKEVPIRILAALSKSDVYRKPNIGMYEVVERIYRDRGLEIDLENSIFVGDAAGRAAKGSQGKDHGDTDYKFALNVGLKFVTPEEHFLKHPRPHFPEPPNGFRPAKLGNLASLPHIVPSHTPITRSTLEIVLFVGPPASGKSSFFRKHFAPEGYEHINQDLLGTRDRCLRIAEQFLIAGKKVVVDNTNRNRETRAHWIRLAMKLKIPIRLFHFLCPLELAKHNNVYRACYGPPDEPTRTLLPTLAFTSYAGAFEKPSIDEGFDEIRGVNFHFEGSEEQRRKWDMYMLEPKR
ncbi:polynucleotide kinase 3'-phosphatase [Kwoniella sp. B9012]